MSLLAGIHPIREALRAGSAIERVLVAKGAGGPKVQEIVDICRERRIPVRFEERRALDKASNGAVHQGVVAYASAATGAYRTIEELIAAGPKLVVLLDGVEDPHNLGAIIRTAHAAGAGAVVIPDRRAAGMTETVAKASAGAIEHLPVVRVGNLNRAIPDLKDAGFWIYGLDERGEQTYDQVQFHTPTAIVMGGEGHGLHEQVRKKCDFVVRIPMAGAVSSLNVSVAAGVVLFEWRRRSE